MVVPVTTVPKMTMILDVCEYSRAVTKDNRREQDLRANEHAPSASPCINERSDEGKGRDRSDLVKEGDDPSPNALVFAIEELEEGVIRRQTTEQRTVEPVHSLAHEADH